MLLIIHNDLDIFKRIGVVNQHIGTRAFLDLADYCVRLRDARLEVGTKLGPYEIRPPLGAAGTGKVWRAWAAHLDRNRIRG